MKRPRTDLIRSILEDSSVIAAREILGERAYPALRDIPEPVELVNIFRPSAEAAGIAVERSRHDVRKVGP